MPVISRYDFSMMMALSEQQLHKSGNLTVVSLAGLLSCAGIG
jgi:hypothetical protein